ncbi:MmgE/PrpD family protein [Tritonibacter scottomollicae]|uniref:2-methylcitrate dehydratase PrpD n=1 Tax=Tritonibacter scottomollicae TaxID=483013 RepID=A0A2T1A5I7_TRISK|nr:MmgE/PrpD family protein [Tritonibacter scottomollicae]PRZ43872.1 2-methylcitrate dehydratase PrpD [Tritonibacter scottomollicae]
MTATTLPTADPQFSGSETDRLLDGLERLAAADLSYELAMTARLRFLDWTGCVLAGAASEKLRITALLNAGGDGPAPIIGTDRTSAPLTAALVNGMHSHVAELDDGHRYGITHAGGPLIAALLAMGHDPRMTSNSLLKGIVVGYEAALRVAIACQPEAKLNGWHGSGVFGVIGAAIGTGVALGYDRSQLNAALAAAATSASGMVKAFSEGSELKPYNAGQPALTGLASALTAGAGFPGPQGILDGPHGLVQMLRGSPANPTAFDVSTPYCIETVYLKPYASCRYCHAPVEAALNLKARHRISAQDVARVEVETYRLAVHKHDHTEIEGPYSARLGIPYCVGAALALRETGMAAFTPGALSNPETLRIMRATHVLEDPALTALVPARRAARLHLYLTDGTRLTEQVDLPRGEPEVPLTAEDLHTKFIDLATFAGLAPETAQSIAAHILNPTTSILDLLTKMDKD